MSWHFNVVRDANGYLSLHEIYRDKDGKIYAWAPEPEKIGFFEDMADLRGTLEYMLRDLDRPVIDEADLPRGKE